MTESPVYNRKLFVERYGQPTLVGTNAGNIYSTKDKCLYVNRYSLVKLHVPTVPSSSGKASSSLHLGHVFHVYCRFWKRAKKIFILQHNCGWKHCPSSPPFQAHPERSERSEHDPPLLQQSDLKKGLSNTPFPKPSHCVLRFSTHNVKERETDFWCEFKLGHRLMR